MKRLKFTPSELKEMQDMRNEGVKIKNIALHFGCSFNSVLLYSQTKQFDKEAFKSDVEKGLKAKQLADKYKIHPETARKRAKEFRESKPRLRKKPVEPKTLTTIPKGLVIPTRGYGW